MESLKLADQNLIPMNCADEVAIDGLRHVSVSNDTKRVESVRHETSMSCNDNAQPEEDSVPSGPSSNDEHGTSVAGEKVDTDGLDDGDTILTKHLNRQRQRAIAAARDGGKALGSRNSYKDKGGRNSSNSKIQRQSYKW